MTPPSLIVAHRRIATGCRRDGSNSAAHLRSLSDCSPSGATYRQALSRWTSTNQATREFWFRRTIDRRTMRHEINSRRRA